MQEAAPREWPAHVEFDEEESFVWFISKSWNFNCDVHVGWSYAGCELLRVTDQNVHAVDTKH